MLCAGPAAGTNDCRIQDLTVEKGTIHTKRHSGEDPIKSGWVIIICLFIVVYNSYNSLENPSKKLLHVDSYSSIISFLFQNWIEESSEKKVVQLKIKEIPHLSGVFCLIYQIEASQPFFFYLDVSFKWMKKCYRSINTLARADDIPL